VLPEIKQLLQLQVIDERLADAASRITRLRGESDHLRRQIEAEHAAVHASREALSRLEHDSRMKNLEVDDLHMQIRAYEKRLNKGIISFKEMEDLRVKIAGERVRINRLEDDALSLMDAIEAEARAHDDAESHLAPKEAALRHQISEAEAEIEETKSQVAESTAERARVVDAVPAYLVTQYEALHAKFAHPVADIRNGTCTGCKLRVSGNTSERARGEMGVVTCEHCSRILYAA
jgi:predicted  nucleic acid-binding Zn-ribbon protein